MEGFLESFIYLAITIVILVLSMRKKKQVELPDNGDKERHGDPFSDLFRDDDEVEEADEAMDNGLPRPAMVPGRYESESKGYSWTEDAEKAEEPNPWMTNAEADKMLMDADAILKEAEENNPIAEIVELQDEGAYEIGLADERQISFNLKNAVIYSEIIEKRTF